MRIIITLIGIILLFPVQAFAQDEREGGTYLKIGPLYSQGSIKGFSYEVTGVSGEIETHFKKDHLWLSGWSLGYRKDNISNHAYGHLLNGKVFRRLDVGRVKLKTSFGIEYGLPSNHFDQTSPRPGSPNYAHLSLTRNIRFYTVPGSSGYGVRYPFIEVSTWANKGPFMAEAGFRLSIMKFGLDRYSTSSSGEFTSSSDNFIRPVPNIFFNLGIRIKR